MNNRTRALNFTEIQIRRVLSCIQDAIKPALKTLGWLFRWMIPVSLFVTLLDYSGVLVVISDLLNPVFNLVGLSGQCSLVFITAILLHLYSAIAVIGSLSLNMREITILAIMCLIAHNLIIETMVQKKTGSSAIRMLVLRIGAAFFAAWVFNLLLPNQLQEKVYHLTAPVNNLGFTQMLAVWGLNTFQLVLKVTAFVFSIIIIQRVLVEFGVLKWLSVVFTPFMKILGLSEKSSFLWIVANVIGLMYGAAIMFDELNKGKISRKDCDLLNHHVAISHSLLEDTLLFVALGVSGWWIIVPRILLAIPVVWVTKTVNEKSLKPA
ncbi:MAG: nucleoside recognition protein [Bacteroidales bacterium]